MFFWIIESVANAAVIPNGTKTLLANGLSKFSINGKPTSINDFKKLRHPPSWLTMFQVTPSNKVSLFSKDLITLYHLCQYFLALVLNP